MSSLRWNRRPASPEYAKQHANQLQFAPRGHYVTITKDFGDGRVTHAYLMSDGKGYLAGQHDFYDEPVTPGHMLKRMLGYEIYCARKQLETERYVADQKKCLDGFSIGQVFRDYKHPGESKPFAKAVVSAIYPEAGNIKLVLSKRGTSTRWEAVVGAAVLRSRVETSETKDAADGLLF